MEKRAKVVRICGIVVNSITILLSIAVIGFMMYIKNNEYGLYGYATDNFLEDAEAFIKNPYSGEMLHGRGEEDTKKLYEAYNEEKEQYLELCGESGASFEKYLYINYVYNNSMHQRNYIDLIPDVSDEEMNIRYEEDKARIINENNGDESSFERYLYGYSLYAKSFLYLYDYLEIPACVILCVAAGLIVLSLIQLIYFVKNGADAENLKTKIFLVILNIVNVVSVWLGDGSGVFVVATILIFLTLFYLFYKTTPKAKVKKEIKAE